MNTFQHRFYPDHVRKYSIITLQHLNCLKVSLYFDFELKRILSLHIFVKKYCKISILTQFLRKSGAEMAHYETK